MNVAQPSECPYPGCTGTPEPRAPVCPACGGSLAQCPACRAPNRSWATYCRACRQPLPAVPQWGLARGGVDHTGAVAGAFGLPDAGGTLAPRWRRQVGNRLYGGPLLAHGIVWTPGPRGLWLHRLEDGVGLLRLQSDDQVIDTPAVSGLRLALVTPQRLTVYGLGGLCGAPGKGSDPTLRVEVPSGPGEEFSTHAVIHAGWAFAGSNHGLHAVHTTTGQRRFYPLPASTAPVAFKDTMVAVGEGNQLLVFAPDRLDEAEILPCPFTPVRRVGLVAGPEGLLGLDEDGGLWEYAPATGQAHLLSGRSLGQPLSMVLAHGAAWVGTANGLFAIRPGFKPRQVAGQPAPTVVAAAGQVLLYGTPTGEVVLLDPGSMVQKALLRDHGQAVTGLAAAAGWMAVSYDSGTVAAYCLEQGRGDV